jgi:outer membrane protein TolC
MLRTVKRLIYFVPVAVCCCGCLKVTLPEARLVQGARKEPLAWKRAAELALGRNPDIISARDTVEARNRARKVAFGEYLPDADGDLTRGRNKVPDEGWKNSLSLGVTATQKLFTGFKTTGDYLQAERGWEAAKLLYLETSADVRLRLRTAYVELLQLETRLEVDKRIAERRKENADFIKLRYESGRENLGSLMRTEAISSGADFDVRKTRREIESQRWRLSRELGGPFNLTLTVDGDLETMVPEPPALDYDYVSLAEKSPRVRRFVKTAEIFKAAIISAQSKVWPKADGAFGYSSSGEGASDLDDRLALDLSVTVPFFRGGKNVYSIAQAKSEYEAALEDARSARDERTAELAGSWAAFRDAWEAVKVEKEFVEASRERAQIVRSQYAMGLASFQDFDISEQELANSERGYVLSLADVLLRQADWEFLQGLTLEEVIK